MTITLRPGRPDDAQRGGLMIGFYGHAVSETNEDMKALIGAATSIVGPGLLLPVRNAECFIGV
jgi:hypothetical protein